MTTSEPRLSMASFLESTKTTISFQVESVESNVYSPLCKCKVETYTYIYIPNMGMCSKTKSSVQLPGEGSFFSPIRVNNKGASNG